MVIKTAAKAFETVSITKEKMQMVLSAVAMTIATVHVVLSTVAMTKEKMQMVL